MPIDFQKLPSEKHLAVWLGPSGGATLGITVIHEPLADEINNVGGTSGMVKASQSIDWNDTDFGTQASDTNNQPSLADLASYETFGATNYGGSMSFFLPRQYDDDSNAHSLIYDLTDEPLVINDVVRRIDGDIDALADAADGQFVSVYRAQSGGETNPFTPGESKRRTVSYSSRGEIAHYVPVGDQAITAIEPASFPEATRGRIRASIQGRDVTCMVEFASDDEDVIEVHPGGFFEITGSESDTATVTITHPYTSDSDTVSVTVAAAP